jgi:hypothetical protein
MPALYVGIRSHLLFFKKFKKAVKGCPYLARFAVFEQFGVFVVQELCQLEATRELRLLPLQLLREREREGGWGGKRSGKEKPTPQPTPTQSLNQT